MGVDTIGRIKGYISPEDITNFIAQKWDHDVTSNVKRQDHELFSKINWSYKINEHSESNEKWYIKSGFISFEYKGKNRLLFYSYSNINSFENLNYYKKFGLESMVRSETTPLSLSYYGDSVEIITKIIEQFGGGWIDKSDCDEEEFEAVMGNKDSNVKPVKYITQKELNELFGGVTVIVRN